ncbi:MAG: CxxC-x17-CxxC domain-containing protein, partial [Patescibacteria group bacterium]|nr:CxxC-x17-CxxC domain-containing protein [Patescibacteria group bacterium]
GDTVKAAVFGNVGTLVLFRVGALDAEELKPEFMPTFTEEDIVNLPKYEIYLKLMIDGISSDPFSARGMPPLPKEDITHNEKKVITVSRERYAKDRELVEDKIVRWQENKIEDTFAPQKNIIRSKNNKTKNTEQFRAAKSPKPESANSLRDNAVCSRCGKSTRISFKPDGIRPVYCKDCLSLARNKKKAEIEARRIAKKAEIKKLEAAENSSTQDPDNKSGRNAEISILDAIKKEPIKFKSNKNKVDKNTKSENSKIKISQDGELKNGQEINF